MTDPAHMKNTDAGLAGKLRLDTVAAQVKRHWKLLILTVLLAALAGWAGMYYFSSPSRPSSATVKNVPQVTPTPTPVPVTLRMEADTLSPVAGKPVRLTFFLDTSVALNGFQLLVSYDPSVFSYKAITAGDFFPKPMEFLKKADAAKGTIAYAVASTVPSKSGGAVAIISLTAKKTAAGTSVTVLPNTKVSSYDESAVRMILPAPLQFTVAAR